MWMERFVHANNCITTNWSQNIRIFLITYWANKWNKEKKMNEIYYYSHKKVFIFIWHIEFKSNKKALQSADQDFVIFWITKFSQGSENLFSFNSSWNFTCVFFTLRSKCIARVIANLTIMKKIRLKINTMNKTTCVVNKTHWIFG